MDRVKDSKLQHEDKYRELKEDKMREYADDASSEAPTDDEMAERADMDRHLLNNYEVDRYHCQTGDWSSSTPIRGY